MKLTELRALKELKEPTEPREVMEPLQQAAGAVWTHEHYDHLVASYGDVDGERQAARETGGIIDLSHRGRIRFTGQDRQTFLQGMLSNDVRLATTGLGIFATVLDPKGRMLYDLTLYGFEESLVMDVDPDVAVSLAKHLNRFHIREKVRFEVEDGLGVTIGVAGPNALQTIADLLGAPAPLPAPYSCAVHEWNGGSLELLRRDFTGDPGLLLRVETEAGPDLWRQLLDAGFTPFGLEALEALRIEAGIPLTDVDMDATTIPLEAGLSHGVNRDKGCYVGQEVIERILSRGHTNRRLVPLRFEGIDAPVLPGALYLDEKEVGRFTSAVYSPALGDCVGLGYVRNAVRTPGTLLDVESISCITTAEVLAAPLFGSGQPPSIRNDE